MPTFTGTIFSTDFVGATDPGLIPVPFTSTTETSSNTVRYNATTGRDAGPGMLITFAGTSAVANAEFDFPGATYAYNSTFTLQFDINFNILPFIGLTGPSISIARMGGSDGVLCSIVLVKTGGATPVLRITDNEHSTTTNGTTVLAGSTWYTVKLVLDGTAGAETLTLYIDGVQEAQKAVSATFTRRFGYIIAGFNTGSGTPVLGTNVSYDNISLTVSRAFNPPPGGNPAAYRMGRPPFGTFGFGIA